MPRTTAVLITVAVLFAVFGCSRAPGSDPTPTDILMAARTYAASQSDAQGDDTHWCEYGEDPERLAAQGAVVALSGGRYRVTGCVVGMWNGRRFPRRFEAIVKHATIYLDIRELPILEFRWL